MFLAGLPLNTLLLLGAAATLCTVALYILKLRRRSVPVPFARLWETVLRDRESSTFFSQLKRWLSLLLQLMMVLALVLALGDPRPKASAAGARNVVVLLDTSASMAAKDEVPSRLELAKGKVKELISGLKNEDRLLLAEASAAVVPLSPLTDDVTLLGQAVAAAEAHGTAFDLEKGLAFAEDVLSGLPNAEVIVVSDGAFEVPPHLVSGKAKLSFVGVGKYADNVAVTELSARRYPLDKSRYEVMLALENAGKNPALVELSLLGDDQLIDVSQLRLLPGERVPRFFSNLAGANERLEARIRLLEGKDYLKEDDRAFALMPERRRAKVLVVSEGNTYLDAALLLDEYLDVSTVGEAQYPPKGRFDVTIFDNVAPPRSAETGAAFYLNPPEAGSPVKRGRQVENFGFDVWERKSPVLRWMALDDVQVASGFTLKPLPSDRVLGASEWGPILVSGSREGAPFLVLGFDPKNSDLVLRVAWPLMILNAINSFVDQDAEYQSAYRTGDIWRLRVPAGLEVAELEKPDGSRVALPVREGRAEHFGEQPGFYRLKWVGAVSSQAFAANLGDVSESRIAPKTELTLGGTKAARVAGFAPGLRQKYWGYLLLLVALVSAIEWFTYHRRLTV
ncbi:MAG: BatA and WFA domain-containing protein [Polyangiaceae bacterium]|nr:BatA and WFA domain-containing protein [Polyangiaceae bacterium]